MAIDNPALWAASLAVVEQVAEHHGNVPIDRGPDDRHPALDGGFDGVGNNSITRQGQTQGSSVDKTFVDSEPESSARRCPSQLADTTSQRGYPPCSYALHLQGVHKPVGPRDHDGPNHNDCAECPIPNRAEDISL